MKKLSRFLKNVAYIVGILCASIVLSQIVQDVFRAEGTIPVLFVFAIFLIALLTDGYFYGVAAAFLAVLAVNYAFTFPYFAIDFVITENLISGVIMIAVALMTSTLTTKIKHQEQIRAQAERERMRANLLRAISHDLRTPLTTIYGSTSALIDESGNFTEEQRRQMLWGIRDDAQYLVRMVENLLSITRIDNGGVKLIKTPVVLDELIDSSLMQFQKRYPNQKVSLCLPEDIVIIPMDALLIQQVVLNLLENAVQHAENMHTLTLSVHVNDNKAYFTVEDDGIGIPRARLEALFTGEMTNTQAPADGQRRNAGIGLSVCAAIIHAHGGQIHGDNKAQGGAVFTFWLSTEEYYE